MTIALCGQVFEGTQTHIFILVLPNQGFNMGVEILVDQTSDVFRVLGDGILLIPIHLDTNDCIFSIAYVIVQKETMVTQRLFLKYQVEDIQVEMGLIGL